MKLKKWLSDNFENGFISGICGSSVNEHLAEFYTSGYAEVLDSTLLSRHGKMNIEEEYEEEPTDATAAVTAYLLERARYLSQILSYMESEYNPIENYSQVEHETIDYDRKKKTRDITNTENPFSRQKTTQTPQIITEQYTEANVVTTTAQTATTSEQQVAPFDSDTYHKQNKTTETPGTITNTEQPYNRKYKTPQVTVTETESIQADKVERQKIEDAAYKDQDERNLTRSGNIGVQTAAQMMAFDEEYWWNFKPLQKLAREIAALLCEGVTAL